MIPKRKLSNKAKHIIKYSSSGVFFNIKGLSFIEELQPFIDKGWLKIEKSKYEVTAILADQKYWKHLRRYYSWFLKEEYEIF